MKSLLTGLIGPPHAKRGNGILVLLAAVTSLICLALITSFPWGRDQSIYALIGHGMLQHQTPYLDLWDFKPPGIFFVYAAAEAWFGQSMAAIRWLEVSGLGVSILCLVVLSRRFQGSSLAGWCAAAFFTLEDTAFGTIFGAALASHVGHSASAGDISRPHSGQIQ